MCGEDFLSHDHPYNLKKQFDEKHQNHVCLFIYSFNVFQKIVRVNFI
jgi:hypothetical protein